MASLRATLGKDVADAGVLTERAALTAQLWGEAADGHKWHQDVTRLRDVLGPPIPPQEEAFFDI
ncbi:MULTISPECIES: hypothetical protein [unclassified Streptomyces]|uniref:hypothetical protein n=1 Tax=unclassified Streptomyces TaxID=2593676 RepID=UPI00224F2DEA|nr:hypothetical protein [Streptomyces sp. NBC_00047]MCX5613176.1 hypothetical protein [Streptomyces sp. NBC_00047]